MPDFMVIMVNQEPNLVGIKTCHCVQQHAMQAHRKPEELLIAQNADW